MNQTRLRYTEPLLREAVRTFFFRAVIRQLGISFFILVAGLIGSLAFLVYQGETGWMVGVLASFVLFVGVFLAAVYVAHLRNTVGKFRQMGTPEASLGYDEQHITFSSELGSATMPWSSITEILRYPRFWLLFFSKSQFVTLPLDCLDEEARAFITRKTAKSELDLSCSPGAESKFE